MKEDNDETCALLTEDLEYLLTHERIGDRVPLTLHVPPDVHVVLIVDADRSTSVLMGQNAETYRNSAYSSSQFRSVTGIPTNSGYLNFGMPSN